MLNNLSLDREYVPGALKQATETDEPVKLEHHLKTDWDR